MRGFGCENDKPTPGRWATGGALWFGIRISNEGPLTEAVDGLARTRLVQHVSGS